MEIARLHPGATSAACLLLAVLPPAAIGQPAGVVEVPVALEPALDSGMVSATGDGPTILFSATASVPGANWIRIRFDEATLGGRMPDRAAHVMITSLLDGAHQVLDRRTLRQWQNTSAYFNGDSVRIDLIAHPGTGQHRVVAGTALVDGSDAFPRNICGSVDDRELSGDPRSARALPVGCTAWLIGDANFSFLSAGHCAPGPTSLTVVQFNVPLSNANGTLNHPPPEHQYAVDPASMQTNSGSIAIGNDWAYFGCFENSSTGLTAYEAQGAAFTLAAAPPLGDGRVIRKTGYGTVASPVSPTWNQVQKTLAGPLTTVNGTALSYPVDSSGGDSGSPVFEEATGLAVAIHTNGGCTSTGGVNHGCGIHHAGLQAALEIPQGVCIPTYLDFDYPAGRPEPLRPDGTTLLCVRVTGRNGYAADTNGARLHVNTGDGFDEIPMQQALPGLFVAAFPPAACGTVVEYYVTCLTASGATARDPRAAPDKFHTAVAGTSKTLFAAFDFETLAGWTTSNTAVTTGAWERGIPAAGGVRGEPAEDYDGSGQCWVTGNQPGDFDLDGGPTRLWSPAFSLATAANAFVRYARWFTNDSVDIDRLDVELTNNFGASWTPVESVPHTEGWVERTERIADYVTLSNLVRVRFSATDNPNNSTTEAAVDAVSVFDIGCAPAAPCLRGDANGDGAIDGRDVAAFTAALLSPPPPDSPLFCACDMNADGQMEHLVDAGLLAGCLANGICP